MRSRAWKLKKIAEKAFLSVKNLVVSKKRATFALAIRNKTVA